MWNASVGWSNGAFKVVNTANGPSIWGVNSGGGNALRGDGYGTSLAVYGESDSVAAIVGRSAGANGLEGYGSAIGVRGESTGTGTGVVGYAAKGGGVAGYSDAAASVAVFGQGPGFAMYSNGTMKVDGNLYVTGSKSGYLVDIAQNVDGTALEQGDVVIVEGVGAPVLGHIPVLKVRRAGAAATSAVVGVVDQRFVPGSADQAGGVMAAVDRADDGTIAPGDYLTLATMGAFPAIKVDAAFGAIAPGSLLVASPHAGYAMAAVSPQPGTIVGKALGSLDAGIGSVPVLVVLE